MKQPFAYFYDTAFYNTSVARKKVFYVSYELYASWHVLSRVAQPVYNTLFIYPALHLLAASDPRVHLIRVYVRSHFFDPV